MCKRACINCVYLDEDFCLRPRAGIPSGTGPEFIVRNPNSHVCDHFEKYEADDDSELSAETVALIKAWSSLSEEFDDDDDDYDDYVERFGRDEEGGY